MNKFNVGDKVRAKFLDFNEEGVIKAIVNDPQYDFLQYLVLFSQSFALKDSQMWVGSFLFPADYLTLVPQITVNSAGEVVYGNVVIPKNVVDQIKKLA